MDSFLFASVFSLAHWQVWSDALIIFFAAYWEYVIPIVFLIYLWQPKFSKAELLKRIKTTAGAVLAALAARYGLAELIRYFYPRERPFVFEGLDALIKQNPLEASFPSGHAIFFMALAVYFLLAGHKKLGWFLMVSTALISLARVAAGIHWPTDILAGWVLGAGVSWLMFRLFRPKKKA